MTLHASVSKCGVCPKYNDTSRSAGQGRSQVHPHPVIFLINCTLLCLLFQRVLQEKLEGAYLAGQEKTTDYEQRLDNANMKNTQVE